MIIYRAVVLIVVFLVVKPVLGQQQLGTYLHYTQHLEQINQAYSLLSDQAKIYSVGRKQWLGVEGAPSTFMLGGHFKSKNERSAAGANLLHNQVGPEQYTEITAFYGHSVRLTDNDYLAGSLGLGYRIYRLQHAMLETSDDATRADINEKIGSFSLSFMYYRPEQLYVGISLPRLGGGSFEEVELFRENYSATAAYLFHLDEGFAVKANSWVSWAKHHGDDRTLGNFAVTAYLNRKFGFGVNYGTTKDMGLLASLALNNKFRFGYGYQFGVAATAMSGMRAASHEISLSYHFAKGGLLNLL